MSVRPVKIVGSIIGRRAMLGMRGIAYQELPVAPTRRSPADVSLPIIQGWMRVAGLDLGRRRDHSASCSWTSNRTGSPGPRARLNSLSHNGVRGVLHDAPS